MVTDCLSPVITPKGVATVVTADGMECLTQGLEFKKIKAESYPTENTKYYGVIVSPKEYVVGQGARYRKTFTDKAAMVLTPDEWVQTYEFRAKDFKQRDLPRMIMGLWMRCAICQKVYLPKRPIRSCCSQMCFRKTFESNTVAFQPLKAETVKSALVEDWVPLSAIHDVTLFAGIECVRVTEVENGDSIYINNILLSSLSLQGKV